MGKQFGKKDIIGMFTDDIYFHFNRSIKLNKVEYSLFSKLFTSLGIEETKNLALDSVKYWKIIKRKLKLTGYPNIRTIYGYRYSIMEILDEQRNRKKKPTAVSKQKVGKYNTGDSQARTFANR